MVHPSQVLAARFFQRNAPRNSRWTGIVFLAICFFPGSMLLRPMPLRPITEGTQLFFSGEPPTPIIRSPSRKAFFARARKSRSLFVGPSALEKAALGKSGGHQPFLCCRPAILPPLSSNHPMGLTSRFSARSPWATEIHPEALGIERTALPRLRRDSQVAVKAVGGVPGDDTLTLQGLSMKQTVMKNNHPAWEFDASNIDGFSGLHIYNSLTDAKEPFYPMNGRTVKYYICGPTTYDAAHMGHARAYLAFDIVRRVLEDYFGYDVIAQMCITDIDDKIILKSRRNKLLAIYEEANHPMQATREKLSIAMAAQKSKLEAQAAELQKPTQNKREEAEREKLMKEQELKNAQFETTVKAVEAASNTKQLIAAGQDLLAELLDKELGHTVQIQEVSEAHARKWERAFFKDMTALGIREPDMIGRVTEHVPDIVDFVQAIVDKGFAYVSNGSVYFDTSTFKQTHEYPKLVPSAGAATKAELAEGEGALADFGDEKRHPNDFALWKRSKIGEPKWTSPWGDGRPGWHIECSTMASKMLGTRLDIHCGGADLKFPHHDNELAQSEACHGCHQWVNYFMHAGHLSIKGLKMSKSLKNFITIEEALKEHTSRQMRLMFLLQSWDKPMEYSEQTMEAAKALERKFVSFFGTAKALLRGPHALTSGDLAPQNWGSDHGQERDLHEKFCELREEVHRSLCDSINTPATMAALSNMVSHVNNYLQAQESAGRPARALLVRKIASYITGKLQMLGVIVGLDEIGFVEAGAQDSREQLVTPFLNAFAEFRDEVRNTVIATSPDGNMKAPLLHACDRVRDESMVELGVRLEDRGDAPSVWKLEDAEALQREFAAAKAEKLQQEIQAKERKLARKQEELKRWLSANVPPGQFFLNGNSGKEYETFDAGGIPTHGADGVELSKSARKKCEKELAKHTKNWNELQKKRETDESFLENLQSEITELEREVTATI